MSDLLSYLDSVSIDVVKRKYYNANKVNAVFDELRIMATELQTENEQLRQELGTQSQEQLKTQETLDSLQRAYREALTAAHARADEMLQSAEKESAAIRKKAQFREENAARSVEECLNTVRVRAEQNVEFINTQLQKFLSTLYEEETPSYVPMAEGKVPEDTMTDIQSRVSAISSEISALEQEKP